MIDRILMGSAGFLLIGSIAGFMLYTPLLPLIATTIVLLGFVLVFALGYCAGSGHPWVRRQSEPQPVQDNSRIAA